MLQDEIRQLLLKQRPVIRQTARKKPAVRPNAKKENVTMNHANLPLPLLQVKQKNAARLQTKVVLMN